MASGMQTFQEQPVSRALPIPANDGANRQARLTRYLEAPVALGLPPAFQTAEEGCVYSASLGSGATALQLGISASFAGTACALAFQNTASPTNPLAPRCFLRAIRLLMSGVPTSGTAMMFATVLDSKDRTPTTVVNLGGTPATATAFKPVPVCTNMDIENAAVGQPYFPLSIAAGAPIAVPSAGQNARTIVGNGQLRAQIPVALDEYVIAFGQADQPAGQLMTAAGAGVSRVVFPHEAVVVGPGQWFLLHIWFPSNATAGAIFSGVDMSWIER